MAQSASPGQRTAGGSGHPSKPAPAGSSPACQVKGQLWGPLRLHRGTSRGIAAVRDTQGAGAGADAMPAVGSHAPGWPGSGFCSGTLCCDLAVQFRGLQPGCTLPTPARAPSTRWGNRSQRCAPVPGKPVLGRAECLGDSPPPPDPLICVAGGCGQGLGRREYECEALAQLRRVLVQRQSTQELHDPPGCQQPRLFWGPSKRGCVWSKSLPGGAKAEKAGGPAPPWWVWPAARLHRRPRGGLALECLAGRAHGTGGFPGGTQIWCPRGLLPLKSRTRCPSMQLSPQARALGL